MPVLALPYWQARGPRFLLALLGLWLVFRLASHWPVMIDAMPPPQPFASELAPYAAVPRSPLVPVVTAGALPPQPAASVAVLLRRPSAVMPVDHAHDATAALPSAIGGEARHAWRLALLRRFVPPADGSAVHSALVQPAQSYVPGLAPAQPQARWPVGPARTGRWSLAAASYWRSGNTAPSVGPASAARLGGSQTTARLTFLVDPRLSLRAYVRATHTPGRRHSSDIAVGAVIRPVSALPVDVHIERRTVVAGAGRDTTLLFAAGGVDNHSLPEDFRLSAYAQAGVADYGKLVGFADGAVVVQREVAAHRTMRLSLGTMVAAAAQPGARRVDAGPRATLLLPQVGQGAQIALDWRERVAGNARPASGLALTLAADF